MRNIIPLYTSHSIFCQFQNNRIGETNYNDLAFHFFKNALPNKAKSVSLDLAKLIVVVECKIAEPLSCLAYVNKGNR